MSRRTRKKGKIWLKRIFITLLILVALAGIALGLFIYKVQNGFPFYEEDKPALELPAGKKRILLFSKVNGFVHKEAIAAAKPVFRALASQNDWFLFEFDEGGVFNPEQLREFDLVIWNNVSGRVLTNDQRAAFQHYIEEGGSFMGLHATGDGSHHWDWYTQNLIGAEFSHHPIEHQIQEARLMLQPAASDSVSLGELPAEISHSDEWYVFTQNPGERGFQVLYEFDGREIDPSGNLLWMKNKNFGMGEHHPVMWFGKVGKGKAFYSSLGHDSKAYSNEGYIQVLENRMKWAVE